MDTLFARISESFDRQGLMGTLGATLRVVEPGRVVISMQAAFPRSAIPLAVMRPSP